MEDNMKPETVGTSVKAPRWKADFFVLALLAASLALNAYLGVKIKKLSAADDTAINPAAAIGASLETLEAHTTEGEPQIITLTAGKPAVIYIFSPECGWCERNLPNITYLAAQRNRDYDFIGLSLSRRGLDAYLKDHKLPFVVYAQPSVRAQKLIQIAGTPQTVVVSSNGRILHNWVGAYRNSVQQEVEAEFKIMLPGLTEDGRQGPGGN